MGEISIPSSPAYLGRGSANTRDLPLRAFETNWHCVFEKTSVMSNMLSDGGLPAKRDFASLSTLMSFSWRCTSSSTVRAMRDSSCTPFISTRAPEGMEMLRSCLMVPIPRLTMPVLRRSVPIASAASSASFPECRSGEVAISTSGMPRRERSYWAWPSFPSIMPALSSSMQIAWMGSLPEGVEMKPPIPAIAVRWKPLVLLPSITFLRIT